MEIKKKLKVDGDSHIGTYRWWAITWNNPQEKWQDLLASFKADYAFGQLELGEKEETPHIQGVLYFAKPVRSTHFKGYPIWCKGLPLHQAEFMLAYCKKTQTRIEGPHQVGEPPKSIREKKDWDLAKDLALSGRTLEIQSSILIPHLPNLLKISAFGRKPLETQQVKGLWIYGEPGAGKSHYVRTNFSDLYIKAQNKWFDGYMGQTNILLDDFDKSGKVLGHHIKIWADKWAAYGEVKGATVPLCHEKFIITSNYQPSDIWSEQEDPSLLEAIKRRFHIEFMMKQNSYFNSLQFDGIIEF